jgi:hypothetical protein
MIKCNAHGKNGHGLFHGTVLEFLARKENGKRTSFRISDFKAQIRNRHFPNIKNKRQEVHRDIRLTV